MIDNIDTSVRSPMHKKDERKSPMVSPPTGSIQKGGGSINEATPIAGWLGKTPSFDSWMMTESTLMI